MLQVLRDKIGSAIRPKSSSILLHTPMSCCVPMVSRVTKGERPDVTPENPSKQEHQCVTRNTMPSWLVTSSVTPRSLDYAIMAPLGMLMAL